MKLKTLLLTAMFSLSMSNFSIAKEVQIDKVAAIVNDGVVLQSEIDTIINRVKSQR